MGWLKRHDLASDLWVTFARLAWAGNCPNDDPQQGALLILADSQEPYDRTVIH
jgi:hypothetical protein